jgi:RNA polymerase sigma-70 factor (ECF subfamily)
MEEQPEKRRDLLAGRLKAGERGAAAELVEIYYGQIYLYMRRLGHGHQSSEDLTQETFLAAWAHIGQLGSGEALNGWLYRIAGNVSRRHWRSQKGREMGSIEGFDVPAGESKGGGGDYEQLWRLKKAVERLPMRLRQVVVLHYMQHLTIREGADAAGVREGTFKSRLNRALKALRKQVM